MAENTGEYHIEIDPRAIENSTRALWARMPRLDIQEDKTLKSGWKINAQGYASNPNLRISAQEAEEIVSDAGLVKGVFADSKTVEVKPFVDISRQPYKLDGVLVTSFSSKDEVTGLRWLPVNQGEKSSTMNSDKKIPEQTAQVLLMSAARAIGPVSTR